jgi:hypothetical protein
MIHVIIVFILFTRIATLLSALILGSEANVVIVSISVVLRLLATCGCTLYFGSMVNRECDSLIESSVVHLPSVGQVGPGCNRNSILYLCFS